jgi:cytoskeletal protein CcmA (bactofilin family)
MFMARLSDRPASPRLWLPATGRVEGSLSAHDLTVLSFVSGSVSARHVQLAPTAVVRADVLHERIAIEAGAELEGRMERRS